jgi:hypothetical protein
MKAQLVRDLHSYDPRAPGSALARAWDDTQARLHCCGLVTPQVASVSVRCPVSSVQVSSVQNWCLVSRPGV